MEAGVTIFSIAYVVVLIVPGIIFKRFFFQGAFSGQFNTGLFADRIITSLFWGILVQIIGILSYSRIVNLGYNDLKNNVQTVYSNLQKNNLPDFDSSELLHMFVYAIYCVILAACLGFFLFKTIRLLGLDLKFPAFRFLNQWHYYFRGEILRTREFRPSGKGRVLSTEVDIIVRDGNDSNLFSGLLTQYTLNRQNELEALYLTGATRYSQSQKGVKAIPGDILIIPYSTVHNLNIRYNYQVRKERERGRYLYITVFGLVLIFCIVYPWFLEISIWRKVLGVITLFSGWLFLSTYFMSFFRPSAGAVPLSTGARILIVLLFLTMLTISAWILMGVGL
ncbi:hypothetical protein C7T94_06025 [Pedobacter yulinensis]|uniref:Uncharacterized protein n=1 Tax=Pedobacter yulinensis TaxID=2126353 RepID=A0A2T3HPC2_9SPHI|nr:hypothetical protein [Pedobacter yulinensis]PST84276.1 hypothetical protein C7T94_06025 [Pedobacter yulinensis]